MKFVFDKRDLHLGFPVLLGLQTRLTSRIHGPS